MSKEKQNWREELFDLTFDKILCLIDFNEGDFDREQLEEILQEFITKTLQQQRENIIKWAEDKESKCTCGCDFGGACLCKEEREGFEKLKQELLTYLKQKDE